MTETRIPIEDRWGTRIFVAVSQHYGVVNMGREPDNDPDTLDSLTPKEARELASRLNSAARSIEKPIEEAHEVEALKLVGKAFRETAKGRGVGRHTITLMERIPYWGWKAERDDGPWQLTDIALAAFYELAPHPAAVPPPGPGGGAVSA